MQEAAAGTGQLPVWLGVADLAQLLGISVSRAYALVEEVALPATRVSGRIRIPRAAFEKWLADQSDRALHNLREPSKG